MGLRAKTGMISEMIPITGRIITYTSGCPKNQNTCWKSSALPPSAGLKKCVPAWRSSSSIVRPAESAGSTTIRSAA